MKVEIVVDGNKEWKSKGNHSSSLGLKWEGESGLFLTQWLLLHAGSYTITWFLFLDSSDTESLPRFTGKLLSSNNDWITKFPLEEEGETIGYHTVTVNLSREQHCRLQVQAENVKWNMEIMRLPQRFGV